MRLAQKYIAENKPALAIPEYRAAVALDPENLDAHANLGVLFFFQGDYTDASPQLRTALKLKPDLWKTQALLGMSEKRSGQVAEARADLESAFPNLKDEKICVESGMELIELDYSANDLSRAASVVGVLRAREPENPVILYTAYRIYSELTNEAMLSLGLVAPKSAQMHMIMAHEMERQNDTSGAIEQYREAMRLNAQLPGLHYELAEALNTSADPALQSEAEAEYKAALAANHFDEKAKCRLGDIAMKHNEIKQAYEDYSGALALQPDDAEANVGLARALTFMNEKQKAIAALEHAVQEDPTNALAHYRLGLLYRQTGKTAEANQEIAKFKQYQAIREQLGKVFIEMRVHTTQSLNEMVDAKEESETQSR
ncbi:tetratricopeptide repeat protein [Paracidobacterium acidisoli]|nr:tetratricopeptide repeat protein [Paracidobacterium acidisoli]MBT9332974.1 tetratricopeptide repeat protein [Paracidobacterium acidisoli]